MVILIFSIYVTVILFSAWVTQWTMIIFPSCTTLSFSLTHNYTDLSFTCFSMYLLLFHPRVPWQNYSFLKICWHILCIGLILFLVLLLQLSLSLISSWNFPSSSNWEFLCIKLIAILNSFFTGLWASSFLTCSFVLVENIL